MIKEALKSISANVENRVTNPFIGTLIIVFTVDNWKLFYTFFNYKVEATYEEKVSRLSELLECALDPVSLFGNVGIALLSMLILYILINVGKVIVDFSQYKVAPFFLQFTDKSKIITKERFNKISKELEDYIEKYKKEKEEKIPISNKLDELEKSYNALLNKEYETIERDKEKKSLDILERLKRLNFKDVFNKLSFIKNSELKFNNFIFNIRNKNFVTENDISQFAINNKLTYVKKKYAGDVLYEFTKEGELFVHYFLDQTE